MAKVYLFIDSDYEWRSSSTLPYEIWRKLILFKIKKKILSRICKNLVKVGPGRGIEIDRNIQKEMLLRIQALISTGDADIIEFNPPLLIVITVNRVDNILENNKRDIVLNIIKEVGL